MSCYGEHAGHKNSGGSVTDCPFFRKGQFFRGEEKIFSVCCVGGARIFGDLNDPNSTVRQLVEQNKIKVLKPEMGTLPHVYYLGLDERFQGRVEGEGTLWQPSGHGG